MTKKQLSKQLELLHKELILIDNRMWKISQKLDIPENTDIKKTISDVAELIKIANGDNV